MQQSLKGHADRRTSPARVYSVVSPFGDPSGVVMPSRCAQLITNHSAWTAPRALLLALRVLVDHPVEAVAVEGGAMLRVVPHVDVATATIAIDFDVDHLGSHNLGLLIVELTAVRVGEAVPRGHALAGAELDQAR